MPSLTAALVASLLATSAMAVPMAKNRDLKPAKAGFRAGAVPRQPGTKWVKRDNEGQAVAMYDGGWILKVEIGGQPLSLNIDTGSSDLWTASTLLSAEQQAYIQLDEKLTGKNGLFDPKKSTTYKEMPGYTYGIGYVDGSGSHGIGATDRVCVGGACVDNMPFGVCNDLHLNPSQKSRDTDGCIGMGFGSQSSLRPNPGPTFIEALMPHVPEPVFATYFRPDSTGWVDFGYTDHTAYDGELTAIKITNTTEGMSGQWGTGGVTFGVDGKEFSGVKDMQMDFDTGSGGFDVTIEVASAYFAKVTGAKLDGESWSYPCGTKLPDLDIFFSLTSSGPKMVTIPGDMIANDANCKAPAMDTSKFEITKDRGNFGVPFYTSHYMVFNPTGPTLSFAAQKRDVKGTPPNAASSPAPSVSHNPTTLPAPSAYPKPTTAPAPSASPNPTTLPSGKPSNPTKKPCKKTTTPAAATAPSSGPGAKPTDHTKKPCKKTTTPAAATAPASGPGAQPTNHTKKPCKKTTTRPTDALTPAATNATKKPCSKKSSTSAAAATAPSSGSGAQPTTLHKKPCKKTSGSPTQNPTTLPASGPAPQQTTPPSDKPTPTPVTAAVKTTIYSRPQEFGQGAAKPTGGYGGGNNGWGNWNGGDNHGYNGQWGQQGNGDSNNKEGGDQAWKWNWPAKQ